MNFFNQYSPVEIPYPPRFYPNYVEGYPSPASTCASTYPLPSPQSGFDSVYDFFNDFYGTISTHQTEYMRPFVDSLAAAPINEVVPRTVCGAAFVRTATKSQVDTLNAFGRNITIPLALGAVAFGIAKVVSIKF